MDTEKRDAPAPPSVLTDRNGESSVNKSAVFRDTKGEAGHGHTTTRREKASTQKQHERESRPTENGVNTDNRRREVIKHSLDMQMRVSRLCRRIC